jgi:GAF domain-containing protein
MTKQEKYEQLLPQVCSLIEGEHDEVAVMSNVVAALHEAMGFFWTGFYRVKDGELLVGPFQGPTACFHIAFGRGVCGTAWKTGKTQVVPDVELFPGHIACSALSRSEIVVPLTDSKGEIKAVLDIDSKEVGTFDSTDQQQLERLCSLVSKQVYR